MQRRLTERSRRRVAVRALRRDAVLVRLVAESSLAVRAAITSLVVSTLVINICGIVRVLVVRVAVWVIVRLLLAMRLGLTAGTCLRLGDGLSGGRGAADLRVCARAGAETRRAVLGTTLRILAKVIVLRSVVAGERALGL